MMRKPIPGACDGNGEKVARNGGSSWPGSESFQMSVKEQKPELRCTQTHHVLGIGGSHTRHLARVAFMYRRGLASVPFASCPMSSDSLGLVFRFLWECRTLGSSM